MNAPSPAPYLSVVIPFYNEEDNIEELHRRLKDVLARLGKTYEIVYIDDGSSDRTYAILRAIYEKD